MQARSLVLALAAASTAQAQFTDLATTADGSVLYFATSFRQKGTDQPLHGKIFRYDANGLSLHAARERAVVSSQSNQTTTNYYHLSMPQVSGDGSRVVYTGLASCAGRACPPFAHFLTEPFALDSQVRLSRNGRYAVCVERGFDCRLWDLQAGESTHVSPPGNDLGRIRAVADDGTYPYIINTSLYVRRNGVETRLTSIFQEEPVQPVIDPAATKVVFTSRWQVPDATFSRIREADLATGALRTLAEGYGDLTLPSVSDDGRRVVFLSTARFDGTYAVGPPQLYVLDIDRDAPRPIDGISEGVTDAILSGNGRVVYAVTALGRLLKINADSGVIAELIPRTLTLPAHVGCVPGSLCTLRGTGFLPGATLAVGGLAAPVVSIEPGAILFQMPWELAVRAAPHDLQLTTPASDSSPFESPAGTVAAVNPFPVAFPAPVPEKAALTYYLPFALAITQDFDALITPLRPARPGEIIHVYLSGLGPVATPQTTGVPASASPLPVTLNQVSCGPEVLYSGLAPGLLGVYQLTMRLPPAIRVNPQFPGFYIECSLADVRLTLFIAGQDP